MVFGTLQMFISCCSREKGFFFVLQYLKPPPFNLLLTTLFRIHVVTHSRVLLIQIKIHTKYRKLDFCIFFEGGLIVASSVFKGLGDEVSHSQGNHSEIYVTGGPKIFLGANPPKPYQAASIYP